MKNEDLQHDLLHPAKKTLEKQGITLDRLAQKLNEELEAHDVKVFKKTGGTIEKDGETFVVDEVIYSKPLIAWHIRQEARKDAQKLLGLYPSEKHEINGHVIMNHELTDADRELLSGFIKQLKNAIINRHRRSAR